MPRQSNCRIGIRIPLKTRYELEKRCEKVGSTITDYVSNAIEFMLTGSTDFDFDGEEEFNQKSGSSYDKKQSLPSTVASGSSSSDRLKDASYKITWDNGQTDYYKNGKLDHVVIEV